MYNVKGSTKIVTKTTTRRGMAQGIETYKDFNKNKVADNEIDSLNDPKPIFNRKCTPNNDRHKNMSPEHEELVNFISDSWNSVFSEFEMESVERVDKGCKESEPSLLFYEDEPCTLLQDFKPFDLESWWGRRLYAYITNTTNANS